MNVLALLLKYGPASFSFLRQHGPLILELTEAVSPVVRKMVEEDVPYAGAALAILDQASEVIAALGAAESPAPRPETAGA